MKIIISLVIILVVTGIFAYTFTDTTANTDSVSPELLKAFNENEELWYQYKLEDSKENLEEILKADPYYPEANRKMAFIEYYYYQNYDKALTHIQRALDKNPNAENYSVGGDILFAAGQYENAIVNYEKALGLDAENTNIYYSLSQSYIKLDRFEEAKEILQKGNRINPFDARINSALHLQYVKDGEYEKAYCVWNEGNVPQTESLGFFGEWNELYRNAIEDKPVVDHPAFGNLYAKLLLYDEAKLEFEKAIKDNPDDSELGKKLDEISLFIKFRNEMKECWDSFYQRRILNGSLEELSMQSEVEGIYKQMLVLFPEIKYSPLRFSNWNSYKLNNEIQKKFNVIISCWQLDGFLGCYFGYVVGDSNEEVSHWGKKTDIRVTIAKNALVNPFWTWYHKNDGLGGWSQTAKDDNNEKKYENVIVLDSKYKMAYDLYEEASNEEKRNKMLKEAEQKEKYLFDKPSLDVFYSSLLTLQLSYKAMDELIEEAREIFDSEEQVKSYVINHLVYDVYVPLTYLHEGQHAIDANYYSSDYEQWEVEYRAMMSEPVYGEMQLLDITSMIHPDIGDDSTGYGKAHTKIFTDIVNYIYTHKEDYPAIDTGKNMMMQLVKLGSDDLKEIAKNVFEQEYPGEKYE